MPKTLWHVRSCRPRRIGRTLAGWQSFASLGRRSAEPDDPRSREVDLDFPREWIEFVDPADPEHLIRADLTWLLSRWTCIFGSGLPRHHRGPGRRRLLLARRVLHRRRRREAGPRGRATKLTPETWQHYRRGFKNYTEMDTIDGKNRPGAPPPGPDGPCVFLNDADFAGGGGCALHAQALRDGVHPLEYKPDVCWQLPVRRDQEWTKRPDGTKILRHHADRVRPARLGLRRPRPALVVHLVAGGARRHASRCTARTRPS